MTGKVNLSLSRGGQRTGRFLRYVMRILMVVILWLVVLATAVWLRVDSLVARPIHFDEATGARITADRLEPTSDYAFNPVHNHGPTLSFAGAIASRLAGDDSWKTMSVLPLRAVTVTSGVLLVMVPLYWRRRFGDAPMLLAATLLATSPLLVYYSRMYIHEILLALFGILVVVMLCRKRTLWAAGAMLGLMFATKESFAISVIAWGIAGVGVAWQFRETIRLQVWRELFDEWWRPVVAMLICAAAVSVVFYTDGLSRPSGIWDAVRTFFIYKTEGGHDKPFGYYVSMMLVPRKDAVWWGETTVALLALLAFVRSFSKSMPKDKAAVIRFLAYATVAHFAIYSLIAYKTPWLMCLPWAHVCLLAGFSLVSITSWKSWPTVATTIAIVITLSLQFRQTRWATGRFEIDQRNAYAYVPTSRDIESMERWLNQLAAGDPKRIEPIAVVGSYYWPLPWYLRNFDAVGYWQDASDPSLSQCGVVLALPEEADAVSAKLTNTHTGFPRSLRTNVVVTLYLRNDLWKQWIEE